MKLRWEKRFNKFQRRVRWSLLRDDGAPIGGIDWTGSAWHASCHGRNISVAVICANTQTARRRLERQIDKRSIGMFGEDEIEFIGGPGR